MADDDDKGSFAEFKAAQRERPTTRADIHAAGELRARICEMAEKNYQMLVADELEPMEDERGRRVRIPTDDVLACMRVALAALCGDSAPEIRTDRAAIWAACLTANGAAAGEDARPDPRHWDKLQLDALLRNLAAHVIPSAAYERAKARWYAALDALRRGDRPAAEEALYEMLCVVDVVQFSDGDDYGGTTLESWKSRTKAMWSDVGPTKSRAPSKSTKKRRR